MQRRCYRVAPLTVIGLAAVQTGVLAEPVKLAGEKPGQTVTVLNQVSTVEKSDTGALGCRLLPVRNLSANTLAAWLDPASNKEAFGNLKASTALAPEFIAATKDISERPAGNWTLPEGVTSVLAVDKLNALAVVGTSEGARLLEAELKELDRPLRQVEIEVTTVQISPEDLKLFGIELHPYLAAAGSEDVIPAGLMVGTVPGGIKARIDKLVLQNKAQRLSSPRVTAIAGLPASIGSSTFIPKSVDLTGALTQFPALAKLDVDYKVGRLVIDSFNFVPTMNADGSVSLFIRWGKDIALGSIGDSNQILRLGSLAQFMGSLKAQDGEILALSGMPSVLFLPESPQVGLNSALPNNVVAFVTTRVIRRVETA